MEAVASIIAEAERCPSCNLTADNAWWVAAQLDRCPTCEDRDTLTSSLGDKANRNGLRVIYAPLETVEQSVRFSSAGRFTEEGGRRRRQWQRERLASEG